MVANAYLEGTYSELYPHVGRDEAGLRELVRQRARNSSWPLVGGSDPSRQTTP